MKLKEAAVLEKVERQLQRRIAKKHGWKRILRRTYMRIYKVICYRLFGRREENRGIIRQTLDLGVDEFGRDVANNMSRYVEILMSRGLKVHTVFVLGSRAKGRWTPDSDIDVAVIVDNLLKEIKVFGLGRILGLVRWFLLADIPMFMGIEPSGCFSREEFLKKLKNFDIFALDAVYYGKVVYDDGFWVYVKKRFKEIEEEYGLRSTELKKKLFAI